MIINLVRHETSDEGTFGKLFVGDRVFMTAELPWFNNSRSISCIPCGEYQCSKVESPKFGNVYQIHDVPDRSHILIHPGNFAGDRSLGKRTDSYGCILLGQKVATIYHQQAVINSRKAFEKFYELTDDEDFTLIVSRLDI